MSVNESPIEQAAKSGDLESLKTLLAVPNLNVDELNCAFQEAAENGYLEVLKLLLPLEPKVNHLANNDKAFRAAAENGHLEVLKLLLTLEPKVNHLANDEEAFQVAAAYGHLEVLKLLLTLEPKVNHKANDEEAFQVAAQNGHLEVLKFLLTLEPKVNHKAYDEGAFRAAAANGHLKVLKLLLTLEPKVNHQADDEGAFRAAAANGHLEVLKLLLTLEPKVNHKANDDEAFREAAANGHLEVCRLIHNLKFGEGKSPENLESFDLYSACVVGDLRGVQLLYDKAFNVINPLADDKRAFAAAIKYGYTDILAILLKDPRVDISIVHDLLESNDFAFKDTIEKFLLDYGYELALDLNRVDFSVYRTQILTIVKSPVPAFKTVAGNLKIQSDLNKDFAQYATRNKLSVESLNADDDAKIRLANVHFDEVQRYLVDKGVKVDVEATEREMRGVLLNLILLDTDNSAELNAFIKDNKDKLMNNDEKALRESCKHISSATNHYQVAFRAFNRFAPVTGWDNLLTEPDSGVAGKGVYSQSSVLVAAPTVKTGSDEVRKRVSSYFRYVQQTGDAEKGDMDRFFYQIASIRRAHNDSSTGLDNPSCLPGTISRIHKTVVMKDVAKDVNVVGLLNEKIQASILAAFNKMIADKSPQEVADIYNAIICMNYPHNEQEVIPFKRKLLNGESLYGVSPDGEDIYFDNKLMQIKREVYEGAFGKEALVALGDAGASGVTFPESLMLACVERGLVIPEAEVEFYEKYIKREMFNLAADKLQGKLYFLIAKKLGISEEAHFKAPVIVDVSFKASIDVAVKRDPKLAYLNNPIENLSLPQKQMLNRYKKNWLQERVENRVLLDLNIKKVDDMEKRLEDAISEVVDAVMENYRGKIETNPLFSSENDFDIIYAQIALDKDNALLTPLKEQKTLLFTKGDASSASASLSSPSVASPSASVKRESDRNDKGKKPGF